jgi:hypothetical protein
MGWAPFIRHLQYPSDVHPAIARLPHPAASYLARLSKTGVPAPSAAPPWSQSARRAALRRGAHISATQHYKDFLHEDMTDYIKKRFWVVLPFRSVRDMPHLKLSPCGVVPQRDRRPRPIIDYTFSGVNQKSLPLAPPTSMQFGRALQRILQRIAYADPRFGPVHMLKFDLSDGYYRVRLSPEAALELAVIIPGDNPSSSLIAVPLSLPMGWALSPPYFCAYTETAADLSNWALTHDTGPCTPQHPLELQSQLHATALGTSIADTYLSPPGQLLPDPIQYTDVYMDDFIALAQPPNLPRTLHHTLKGILSVFRDGIHPHDPPERRHIISSSKLNKGDAAWSTEKNILGWLLNTTEGTLRLQPHKASRLCTILRDFSFKVRTSRRKWQSLLGELRYMAPALQGTRYLFSVLQHVLRDQPSSSRLRLSPLVKQALSDWSDLASTLSAHPVPIASLVPRAPHYVGAVDASSSGCGGFWISTTHGALPQPLAFRQSFPVDLQNQLVSATNPSGVLTNSDLELAAIALGVATLNDHAPTPYACIYAASDNTPAVAWCTKGSTSSVGANAHLLRWIAQLARESTFTLHPVSIPGLSNRIADFCSRVFHLQDPQFIQALNTRFPTYPSWQLAHPQPEHVHSMISALSRKMLPWRSAAPAKAVTEQQSTFGNSSANQSPSTPPWQRALIPSLPSNSLPIDTAQAKLLPAALKSAVRRWVTPFAPWDRRSPAWAYPTPALPPLAELTSA